MNLEMMICHQERKEEKELKGTSEDSEENISLVQAPAASRLHPPFIFFPSSHPPPLFPLISHLFIYLSNLRLIPAFIPSPVV